MSSSWDHEPSALAAVDRRLAAVGHETFTDQPLDPFLVERRPQPSRSTRREPLHHAVVVDSSNLAVDPPEAQSFFDEVVIDRAIEIAGLLAVDNPQTLRPGRGSTRANDATPPGSAGRGRPCRWARRAPRDQRSEPSRSAWHPIAALLRGPLFAAPDSIKPAHTGSEDRFGERLDRLHIQERLTARGSCRYRAV